MANKTSNINSSPAQKNKSKKIKTSGVIVLTIVAMCIVFFAAKAIFSSNNMEIPVGIDTATINSNTTTAPVVTTIKKSTNKNAKADNKAKTSKKDNKKTDESSQDDSTTSGEKAYVKQYANLHTEPSKDSENIVCMSPNVEVDVLEKLDNGYWKIYFMNVDGPHTGYLWGEYLQSSPVQ